MPVDGPGGENFRQHQEHKCPGDRAKQSRHAPQHNHEDQLARAWPVHHVRRNKAFQIGLQQTGNPAHDPGDHESGKPVAIGRHADSLNPGLVRFRRAHHHAEARMDQPPADQHAGQQHRKDRVVHGHLVFEGEEADPEITTCQHVQAVIAAIALGADRQEEDHLRQGQGDHDEIDAAGPQADSPKHERDGPA